MSDLNSRQTQEEMDDVRSFLNGRLMGFSNLRRGSDPPDVIVDREGLPQLGIEHTTYHPEADRVGMERRAKEFKGVLDGLIVQSPKLKGVSVAVHFRDTAMPGDRRHTSIAIEMVRFIEHAVDQGWVIDQCRRFSVVHGCEELTCLGDFFVLPAEGWSVLAKYVSVVYLFRIQWDGYLPSQNFYAQSGYCSPYPEAFLKVFSRKEQKVRKAIELGKYAKGCSPLYLLVVCNTRDDLTSEIYGSDGLQDAVEESGFDFANSVFDEIWLMDSRGGGRSQRLYPWQN
jgi:hypothetical protein